MTFENPFAEMERWAALLPPRTERIPARCRMTPDIFAAILRDAPLPPPSGWWSTAARFDAIPVDVEGDLDAPWIIYDQHGEEMQRGEW